MSKSLTKLIDFSLLPSALLVIGKFFGLYISIQVFNLQWGLRNIPNSFFSLRPIFYSEDIIVASTYSDIFMFLVIAVGFSITLIQALFFHSSHVDPNLVSRLGSKNLLGLIKSSFDLYHKASIWALFLWLTNILIIFNVLTYKTEVWVLLVTTIISIVLTVLMLRDVHQEIELSKKGLFSGEKPVAKFSY